MVQKGAYPPSSSFRAFESKLTNDLLCASTFSHPSILHKLTNSHEPKRPQTEPEDYETILASLAIDIQNRQTRLSEIRLRERRASLLVTLYTLGTWAAYVSFWYMGLVPSLGVLGTGMKGERGERVERVVGALPVFVGPVLYVFFWEVWEGRS